MTLLVIGLFIFLGVHALPITANLRTALRERLGAGGYRSLFTAASAIGLGLIIYGYGLARQDPTVLWLPPVWMKHVTFALMLPAFILLAAAYSPGKIKEKVRHPMLAAVKVWAFAHLLANGTLADLLLFGGFLAWAVADRISVKRRERAGLITVKGGPVRNDAIAVIVGVVAYIATLFWLHEWVIGVGLLS